MGWLLVYAACTPFQIFGTLFSNHVYGCQFFLSTPSGENAGPTWICTSSVVGEWTYTDKFLCSWHGIKQHISESSKLIQHCISVGNYNQTNNSNETQSCALFGSFCKYLLIMTNKITPRQWCMARRPIVTLAHDARCDCAATWNVANTKLLGSNSLSDYTPHRKILRSLEASGLDAGTILWLSGWTGASTAVLHWESMWICAPLFCFGW